MVGNRKSSEAEVSPETLWSAVVEVGPVRCSAGERWLGVVGGGWFVGD